MGEHIFLRRQDSLRQKLSEQNLDGILSSNLTNIRYLCGFTGSAASCLIIPDEAYFISDDRYEIQSKQQVKGLKRFIDFGSHLKIIKDNNLIPNGLKVAFEGDHISANSYKKLSESFPNVHWESTSMILEQMQAVKDDTELEAIRTAVKITDAIYTEILPMLRVGVTEKEIANHLVLRYRQESDGEAYHPIVAGGPNSALPHAIPSNRVFQKGDFILIDAAAKYAGYHADMTRTSVMGSADDKHHEIYTIVKGSQQSGCDAAHAGVPCIEIDRITRDYIKKRGYGKYYNHGTGHGLGLEIHTEPRLSHLSEQILQENNVVTIEPGIYLPNWGGVRIEDDLIIGKENSEILNQTTKDLAIL